MSFLKLKNSEIRFWLWFSCGTIFSHSWRKCLQYLTAVYVSQNNLFNVQEKTQFFIFHDNLNITFDVNYLDVFDGVCSQISVDKARILFLAVWELPWKKIWHKAPSSYLILPSILVLLYGVEERLVVISSANDLTIHSWQ